MGYCGLDRLRRPLSGDEIRACWDRRPEPVEAPAAVPPSPAFMRTAVPRREFIEVSPARRASSGHPAGPANDRLPSIDPVPAALEPRWRLWEDVEG